MARARGERSWPCWPLGHNANVSYYVYILASGQHGTLYVGVTNSLENRVAQHRAKQIPGFTKR